MFVKLTVAVFWGFAAVIASFYAMDRLRLFSGGGTGVDGCLPMIFTSLALGVLAGAIAWSCV